MSTGINAINPNMYDLMQRNQQVSRVQPAFGEQTKPTAISAEQSAQGINPFAAVQPTFAGQIEQVAVEKVAQKYGTPASQRTVDSQMFAGVTANQQKGLSGLPLGALGEDAQYVKGGRAGAKLNLAM